MLLMKMKTRFEITQYFEGKIYYDKFL